MSSQPFEQVLSKVGRANRQWKDLPLDILRSVMESLSFVDRIRIRAVCKDWLLLAQKIDMVQPTDKYPWIMSYNWDHSIYILHDLLARKSYGIKQKDISDENRNNLVGAEACATSYCWILFLKYSKGKGDPCIYLPTDTRTCCFILYNPFSSDLLILPKFEYVILNEQHHFGTCFIDLDSHNSLVLVASQGWNDYYIHIRTCRPGDITWKKSDFAIKELSYLKGVTCADGIIFYCVFDSGKVGVYNREKDELTMLVLKGEQEHYEFGFWDGDDVYLCCDSLGSLRVLSYCRTSGYWWIHRFSFSDQIWIEEECWMDEAIYVGPSYFSIPVEKGEVPRVEIYFHENNSVEDQWTTHRVVKRLSPLPTEQRHEACEWMPEPKPQYYKAWIQAPYAGARRAKDLIRR